MDINDIQVKYLTKNRCYQLQRYIAPTYITVHSTGCSTTPSQLALAWDNAEAGALVCAALSDTNCIQFAPWNMRCWHGGAGENGSVNDTDISFEICEPEGDNRLLNEEYFNAVYPRVVALLVYLCKLYNIQSTHIRSHAEGAKAGLAVDHADVGHWFPLHGKNMDILREDVRRLLGEPKPIVVSYKVIVRTTLRSDTLGWTPTYCSVGSILYRIDDTILYDSNGTPHMHCRTSDNKEGYYNFKYLLVNEYDYIVDEYTITDGEMPSDTDNNEPEVDVMVVNRVYGNTACDTNIAVLKYDWNQYEKPLFICTLKGFEDAMSISPIVAKYQAPVVLTPIDSLPSKSEDYIKEYNPSHIIIIGGTGAVSSTVESTLKSI